MNGGAGPFLKGKTQGTGEAYRPHHPERVFVETHAGVPDGFYRFPVEVLLAPEKIDKISFGVHRQGVNGKVAPLEICLQTVREFYFIRMALVGIF